MPRLPVRYDWPRVVLLLRDGRSQTQAEFAHAMGCSVSTVSKWERGETAPTAKHRRAMEAMSEELGISLGDWPEPSKQTALFQGHP